MYYYVITVFKRRLTSDMFVEADGVWDVLASGGADLTWCSGCDWGNGEDDTNEVLERVSLEDSAWETRFSSCNVAALYGGGGLL